MRLLSNHEPAHWQFLKAKVADHGEAVIQPAFLHCQAIIWTENSFLAGLLSFSIFNKNTTFKLLMVNFVLTPKLTIWKIVLR